MSSTKITPHFTDFGLYLMIGLGSDGVEVGEVIMRAATRCANRIRNKHYSKQLKPVMQWAFWHGNAADFMIYSYTGLNNSDPFFVNFFKPLQDLTEEAKALMSSLGVRKNLFLS